MSEHVASRPASKLYQVIVTRKSMETEDIAAFHLSGLDAEALPSFTAGAHIDVHLTPGLIRQYSLCNAPGEQDTYVIAVKRETGSRGGSKYMHDNVQVGSVLSISSPRNNFPLLDDGEHSLLVAGGIGITPILSMAQKLHRDGRSFELDYFVRSREQMAFGRMLEQADWTSRVSFHLGLDQRGTRNRLKTRLLRRPGNAHLYVCGPSMFIDCVTEITSQRWPSSSIHQELFSPPQNLHGSDDVQFTVVLARRGIEIIVPSGRSILDALHDYGIDIDASCRQGFCGTCLTDIIEGDADHRDTFLSAEERSAGKLMLPCVSRANGTRIVLDL